MNDLSISKAFGTSLTGECADFIELTSAVYLADRLCKRGSNALNWSRTLHVSLPVRIVSTWEDRTALLIRVLQDLTGDTWSFLFTKRTSELRKSEVQTVLFSKRLDPPSTSILFSGGLDSLAGLVRQQRENWNELIAISVLTNKRIAPIQTACLAAVQRAFPRAIHHVSVRVALLRKRGTQHAFDGEERSQRTRGFLFQALGAVTAHAAGVNSLIVPENGIGAINLPYVESQYGTQSGRAANPLNLRLMSELCSSVFGETFAIELPHRLETKGELLHALRDARLSDAVMRSVSCDKFPQRLKHTIQCGRCTSCLLRRQSLFQAGLGQHDLGHSYAADVMEPGCNTNDEKWYHYRVMEDQAERLDAAIRSASPEFELINSFPALAEQFLYSRATTPGANVLPLIDLYRRYCAEWRTFHQACSESQFVDRMHHHG